MRRPVWLFSMDTERFRAPPLTTGALTAYFLVHGRSAGTTDVELVHFHAREEVARWLDGAWVQGVRDRARMAVEAGEAPVFGLSCYTWNMAEFLHVARAIKSALPEALLVAGGPHVQRAEDYLVDEPFDVIVLGEGEETLTALLDCRSREEWRAVAGCAYLTAAGAVERTPARARTTDLDRFPSALDVIPLRDPAGRPLYKEVAYETSRGCPYRCAFCEWGTGAIGTRMYQRSLARIRRDLERLVAGGIEDVWFCDSNFGALREDLAKAEMLVDLRRRTGLPRTFSTSWSKNHNARVHDIVRLLHRSGLLMQYHVALQTLTPRALVLSHRTNMRANDYEPVVRSLAAEGVPVAAELIWGLPGDTLAEFEENLERLIAAFPNVNIFGYTLLPGTEFFERRVEYRLETVPVAGYGKAKGEYVVGCHTFSRDEGEEGYFLITSYIVLARGQLMPRTVQLLALEGRARVGSLLRAVLRVLIAELAPELPAEVQHGRMDVYERRASLYLALLAHPDRTYALIERSLAAWLGAHGADDLVPAVVRTLALDRAFRPRHGRAQTLTRRFDFPADRVEAALARMELPAPGLLEPRTPTVLDIHHPGGVGEVLLDPDGGAWMRGRLLGSAA